MLPTRHNAALSWRTEVQPVNLDIVAFNEALSLLAPNGQAGEAVISGGIPGVVGKVWLIGGNLKMVMFEINKIDILRD